MSSVKFKLSKITLINSFIVCILIIIALVVMYLKSTSSTQQNVPLNTLIRTNKRSNNTNKEYTNPALYHSTKSVDGEHQFTNDTAWKSQPSKCFDCESQLHAQCGDACVYNGTKQKLFSQT